MKTEEIRAFYQDDIRQASDLILYSILRGQYPGKKPIKRVRGVLEGLANDELRRRGVEFPQFTACFVLL
jgi:hypothetical protein